MTFKIGTKPARAIIFLCLLYLVALFPAAALAGYFPSPAMTNISADFLVNFKIDGLPAAPGDEVAFFDPQGVICGLYVVNTPQEYYPIAVYGDDVTTAAVDEGASPGDSLTVKVWQAASSRELSGTKLSLTGGVGQGSYLPSAIPPVWQERVGYVLHVDTPTHFPRPTATIRVSNFIGNLTINGQPASVGDEIAVYDSNGVLAGLARITTAGKFVLSIYGDDPATTNVDEGAVSGEPLTFKVWDHTTATEYGNEYLYLSPGEALGSFYMPAAIPPTWSEDPGYVLNVGAAGQARLSQTINFAPLTGATYGDAPIALAATGGASGNPVIFTVTSGPGTISGNTLTITGAGTIAVTASQAGNASYSPAPEVQRNLIVAKAAQAITIAPVGTKSPFDPPFSLSASGGASGNPIVFTVVSGPATIEGRTVTLTGAGSVTVSASQAGNENFEPATASLSFDVIVSQLPPDLSNLSTLADGEVTSNPVLNIAGRILAAKTWTSFTVNGAAVKVAADGSFSHAVRLMTGTNTVAISATDSSGRTSNDNRTIILDPTAPRLVIVTPVDNSSVRNPFVALGGVINDALEVKINGVKRQSLVLSPGLNSLQITGTDQAGKKNSLTRTVYHDGNKPTLAVVGPMQDSLTNKPSYILKGVVADLTPDVALSLEMDGHIYLPSIRYLGNKVHFEQPLRFSEEKTYEITVTAESNEGTFSVKRNIIYIKGVPGDLNGNGHTDMADVLVALQIMAGLREPTAELIFRGDVAPLLGGESSPDGLIDLADVLVLLRTITGSIP